MGCGHDCGSCGCGGGALELTEREVELLGRFAQIPFLPVARRWDSETPVYLEEETDFSGAIVGLRLKRLIRVDYDLPLVNFDYAAYGAYPCRGSMALTERGQAAVELLEIQGAAPAGPEP